LWLINCAPFNSFVIYKKLNPTTKLRYKEFLLRVAKAWAADKMEAADTECDWDPQLLPHVGLMWTPWVTLR
jgi:hypothetical protein